MILLSAAVVVFLLLVVALWPVGRSSEPASSKPSNLFAGNPKNDRRQRVQEEAQELAEEYQRQLDEQWRDEVRAKASAVFGPAKRTTGKS